jgi:peroxiredoxin family protein
MDETISIVLFSGLTAGAAALGRPVKILLQYWALESFRADRITADHGLVPEAGPAGKAALDAAAKAGQAHWTETLRMAKELGEVDIQACSASMELLGLKHSDLDPIVDGVEGVAAFYVNAGEGQILFI